MEARHRLGEGGGRCFLFRRRYRRVLAPGPKLRDAGWGKACRSTDPPITATWVWPEATRTSTMHLTSTRRGRSARIMDHQGHQADNVGAEGLLGRADFLKLAGAAGIGAAAGGSLLPGAAGAAVRTNLDPTDFDFDIRERFRPFDLLAKNFIQLDDDFERDSILDYTTVEP